MAGALRRGGQSFGSECSRHLIRAKTSSARATHADLAARGVEFTQPPVVQSYGVDAGFRDPWGSQFRMVQRYAPAP